MLKSLLEQAQQEMSNDIEHLKTNQRKQMKDCLRWKHDKINL